LDATRWSRWFGRHTLALLVQGSGSDQHIDRYKIFNKATVGQTGWPTDPEAAQNTLLIRRYFVSGVVSDDQVTPKTLLDNLVGASQPGKLGSPTGAVQPGTNLDLKLFQAATGNHVYDLSTSIAWQAFWLKERLVTTVGLRRDDISTYSGTGQRNTYDPAVPVPSPMPAGQTLANYSYFTPSSQLVIPYSAVYRNGITRTYAGVFHAASWLALTYNTSENFSPAGAAIDFSGQSRKNSRDGPGTSA
jgi:hypothetical protein